MPHPPLHPLCILINTWAFLGCLWYLRSDFELIINLEPSLCLGLAQCTNIRRYMVYKSINFHYKIVLRSRKPFDSSPRAQGNQIWLNILLSHFASWQKSSPDRPDYHVFGIVGLEKNTRMVAFFCLYLAYCFRYSSFKYQNYLFPCNSPRLNSRIFFPFPAL